MARNEARRAVICPCHDVTVGDIEDAIDHGHTDPETIKRATAVYMGACQGKFCSPLVQRLLADRGVERAGEQRRPAARIPVVPVPLGMLVARDAHDADADGSAESAQQNGAE
ncbi:(2Fe-2S)-binding protein [Leucobacter tenebrionis]|uniref:(2Fe-2S)-binding protein n=1 Tax=Leucobacter tenebrionis TaxID=2873270 RepID=UPI001CA6D792|nr:(2Fe-2S)-binding protein [Leucobacter tenebrionis]QZY52588.1 (2Fe-2S)-binding protein [Leucobacter tenebrionis]